MRRPYNGTPSPGWRQFLTQHSNEIWACDLFTVRTIWFQTLYVFFVVHHGNRELIHARVTAHPNSDWLAQQMVEACGMSSEPLMNTLRTTIDGALIEVLARQHHVHMLGTNQETRPGVSRQNRSSAGCIMYTNGQLDNTDAVFAPHDDRVLPTGYRLL
jgi:hypothetical protein